MDFITAPLVVGIISYTIYKLFELIFGRKERLMLIEKFTQSPESINFKMPAMTYAPNFGKFTALRTGLILSGLGVGLLAGALLAANIALPPVPVDVNTYIPRQSFRLAETVQIASVLVFGGLGMLVSFIIEYKISRGKKE